MARYHLVRIGALGQVGRFNAVEADCFTRGTEVIVRTDRGLEQGQVLAPPAPDACDAPADGAILRAMTVEDRLLAARLEKNRHEAFAACVDLLKRRQLDATLLDVEPLFDGHTLFFYFLGEVSPVVEQLTAELAETYDAEVQMSRFAETLVAGCGPDCGTEQAAGAGCGACSSCQIASACGNAVEG